MKELMMEATPENVDKAIEFVDEMLEEYGCGMKEQMAIDVAVDELFANIAHYAYNPETGFATVRVDVVKDPLAVEITFVDNGVPYDPLAKADPDTTLSVEDREIGGLGILIVKKTMDAVNYEYKDGKNILTIKKNISCATDGEGEMDDEDVTGINGGSAVFGGTTTTDANSKDIV